MVRDSARLARVLPGASVHGHRADRATVSLTTSDVFTTYGSSYYNSTYYYGAGRGPRK